MRLEGRKETTVVGIQVTKEGNVMFVFLKRLLVLLWPSTVVKTRNFQGKGVDLIPCWGTEILSATWHGQEAKEKKEEEEERKDCCVPLAMRTGKKYDG